VVPADEYQGEIQRLLYIHVPTAWLAMLSFLVVFLMSMLYLVQRKLKWDVLAVSAVEIGVISTALTLIVGSLYARPTWGTWWTWDLIVRSMTDDPEQRARWAAVIGIIGFIQVPIVYLSVFWWRSLHQPPSSPRSMAAGFGLVLLLNLVAYTIAFTYLVMRRYKLGQDELALELAGPEEEK